MQVACIWYVWCKRNKKEKRKRERIMWGKQGLTYNLKPIIYARGKAKRKLRGKERRKDNPYF